MVFYEITAEIRNYEALLEGNRHPRKKDELCQSDFQTPTIQAFEACGRKCGIFIQSIRKAMRPCFAARPAVIGHPVHYLLCADDDGTLRSMTTILASALLEAGRIQNQRLCSVVCDENVGRYREYLDHGGVFFLAQFPAASVKIATLSTARKVSRSPAGLGSLPNKRFRAASGLVKMTSVSTLALLARMRFREKALKFNRELRLDLIVCFIYHLYVEIPFV